MAKNNKSICGSLNCTLPSGEFVSPGSYKFMSATEPNYPWYINISPDGCGAMFDHSGQNSYTFDVPVTFNGTNSDFACCTVAEWSRLENGNVMTRVD